MCVVCMCVMCTCACGYVLCIGNHFIESHFEQREEQCVKMHMDIYNLYVIANRVPTFYIDCLTNAGEQMEWLTACMLTYNTVGWWYM